MADLILKDGTGKIWVNGAGKVLKAKKFSEIPIQDGLAFWGQADPTLLTQIDGLVSEAYDVRDGYGGARKMITTTVSRRFNYGIIAGSNMIYHYGTSPANLNIWLTKTAENMRNMFYVGYTNYSGNAILNLGNAGLATVPFNPGLNQGTYYVPAVASSYYFQNNVKRNTSNNITGKYIVNSLDDYGLINSSVYIAIGLSAQATHYNGILEWGWYNRVLSEAEVIYNINCLNQKYSLF